MTGGTGFNQLFPAMRLPGILLSLIEAASNLRKKSNTEWEDRITARLYRELVRAPIFRDGPLDIRLQPDILASDPGQDTPGGRIDLLVSCGLGYEVYFAIEAKSCGFVHQAAGPDRVAWNMSPKG